MGWHHILSKAVEIGADKQGVRYFELPCGKVLNPSRSPGGHSASPYLNCELGCVYCFARDIAERRQPGQAGDSFCTRIYVKRGAPQVLWGELEGLASSGRLFQPITLGTASDPYQPIERDQGRTRDLLSVFLAAARRYQGQGRMRLSLSTKSDLILRDLDLLVELVRVVDLRVSVSVASSQVELSARLEPGAPSPLRRFEVVRSLSRAGVPAGVHCMPILPGITDRPRDLRFLVCQACESGARYFTTRVLALQGATREGFFTWLEEHCPSQVSSYRRWYRRAQPPRAVRERIQRVVDALRRQYRLPATLPFDSQSGPAPVPQLDLFSAAQARELPRAG